MPSQKASKRHRKEIMSNILQNKPNQVTTEVIQTTETTELYLGPLPNPDMLERYKNAGIDFPERIMRMAEAHNKADTTAKNRISLANLIIPIIGQVFTLMLGIGGIFACVYLAKLGYTGEAVAAIIASFSPMIINAFRGLNQTKETKQKR